MTDYTDALDWTTQTALHSSDPMFSSCCREVHAYLKIGLMHGVTVSVEDRLDADRQVPKLVRDGAVLRFLIPRGANLANLTAGLGKGGTLSELIDKVLAGHLLKLAIDGATGCLTDAAAIARDELLDAIESLTSVEHAGPPATEIAVEVAA